MLGIHRQSIRFDLRLLLIVDLGVKPAPVDADSVLPRQVVLRRAVQTGHLVGFHDLSQSIFNFGFLEFG